MEVRLLVGGENTVTAFSIRRALIVAVIVSSVVPSAISGSSPIRFVPFGFFIVLQSFLAFRDLIKFPSINFARRILTQWPWLSLVVLLVSIQFIRAIQSTTRSQVIIAGGCAATLLFLHVVVPIVWTLDYEFLIDTIIWIILLVLVVSFVLFISSAFLGGSLGLAPTSTLLLEKRNLVEKLGLPFIERGILLEPNWLGALTTILVPLSLYRRREPTARFPKAYTIPALCLCGITLVSSLSIIALFSAFATSIFFVLFKYRWAKYLGLTALSAFILFFWHCQLGNMIFIFCYTFRSHRRSGSCSGAKLRNSSTIIP